MENKATEIIKTHLTELEGKVPANDTAAAIRRDEISLLTKILAELKNSKSDYDIILDEMKKITSFIENFGSNVTQEQFEKLLEEYGRLGKILERHSVK